MRKPSLLYYCRHTDGMGNLVRALSIGARLSRKFRVVLVNGGLPEATGVVPSGIQIIQLPPLKLDIERGSTGSDLPPVYSDEYVTRREALVSRLRSHQPSVVIVDTFPFGPAGLADELMPLVEAASQSAGRRPLMICTVKDIARAESNGSKNRHDFVARVMEQYFDAVIVHSDPLFARLQEFFQPKNAPVTPIYHSGFVVRDRPASAYRRNRERRVLVAAGCGLQGNALYESAVEAHRLLWDVEHLPMTIIAGPYLPDADFERLARRAKEMPSLQVKRLVPDLGAEFAKVKWVVSHGAYNASVDVLASNTPALLLPSSGHTETEQIIRVQRLSHSRSARTLMPRHLNGASLASAIQQLTRFESAPNKFNLDGAEVTANVVHQLFVLNSDDAGRSDILSTVPRAEREF